MDTIPRRFRFFNRAFPMPDWLNCGARSGLRLDIGPAGRERRALVGGLDHVTQETQQTRGQLSPRQSCREKLPQVQLHLAFVVSHGLVTVCCTKLQIARCGRHSDSQL